jgi:hypothetical protein
VSASRSGRLPRWLRSEFPLLTVLAAVLLGVVFAVVRHWRIGLVLAGGGLLLGAGFRALLRESQVGSLAVRNRMFDVVVTAVLGGTLIVLSQSLSATA